MSFQETKKYTFKEDVVLKGRNKAEGKDVGGKWVRTNPILEPIREFKKGEVVDARFISGRAGSSINFSTESGLLPNGSDYSGVVNFTVVMSRDFKNIEPSQTTQLPKKVSEKTTKKPFLKGFPLLPVAFGFLAIGVGIYIIKNNK